MNKKVLLGIIVVTLIATLGMAFAAPTVGVLNGSNWKVLNKLTLPSGNDNFLTVKPTTFAGGIQFNLPSISTGMTTRYLITNYNGVLTGKTIVATANVVTSGGGVVVINPNPLVTGPPTARIEFQDVTSGPYQPTDYWWYVPGYVLTTTGSVTLTASTTVLANWIDINGEHPSDSATLTAAFNHALANVKQVSLSFGSDNYYAGGVCASGGSAVFQLLAYTISVQD